MDIKALLLVLVGAAVMNNIALISFFGVTPLLGYAAKGHKIRVLGLAVLVATVITAVIAYLLDAFVLLPAGLGYMQSFVFVIVVLAVVYLMQAVCGKLGWYFPLIALNSSVLGVSVMNAAEGLGFAESLFSAVGAGLGFWLMLAVMNSLQLKLSNPRVPKAFRGLPINVLAAGIIALALYAF